MPSRIPLRDALTTFVPDAIEPETTIAEMQTRLGESAWYPIQGGHRLLMPHDGEEFDATRFSIEIDAWDHEHCEACQDHIPAMTLCYVTEPDLPYKLFCKNCFVRYISPKTWWKFWRH